jgi:hypothetical protein
VVKVVEVQKVLKELKVLLVTQHRVLVDLQVIVLKEGVDQQDLQDRQVTVGIRDPQHQQDQKDRKDPQLQQDQKDQKDPQHLQVQKV